MRPLIWIILVTSISSLFGLRGAAFASSRTVDIQSRFGRNAAVSEPGTQSAEVQSLSTDAAFAEQGLKYGLGYRGTISWVQPDYSQVGLVDAAQKPLSAPPNRAEIVGDFQGEWQRGSLEVSFGYRKHLSDSPYAIESVRASGGFSFFNQGTRLNFEAVASQQKRPLTYFIDRDLRVKARPTSVSNRKLSMTYEQVLNSRWRGGLKLSTQERVEERPRAVGFETSHAVALADSWFLKVGASYWTENHSAPLKNERGYFDAKSADLELGFEPSYGWLLKTGYGLSVEQETDPRVPREIQVGSDRYSFSIQKKRRDTTYLFSSLYSHRNDGGSAFEFSGGLKWEI